MIFTIGTEIIEAQELREAAARVTDPAQDIFTDREANYCSRKQRPCEHYAARYAAKRAALKALGVGEREELEMREVEVVTDERGKPEMLVHGRIKELFEQQHIQRAILSLAHCRDSAIAVVILQG